MNTLVTEYKETDQIIRFIQLYLKKQGPLNDSCTTSPTFKKRKRSNSSCNSHCYSDSRSLSPSSCTSSCDSSYGSCSPTRKKIHDEIHDDLSIRQEPEIVRTMLDDAYRKREELAVQFFKCLSKSIPCNILPDMIEDLCYYYGSNNRDWKRRLKQDFDNIY